MRRRIFPCKGSVGFGLLLMAIGPVSFGFAQAPSVPNGASAQPQERYLISMVHVQLAAQREWEDMIKNELLPALKKTGVTRFAVWKAVDLGEMGSYFITRPIKDLSELDAPEPIIQALGQEGSRTLIAKLDRITKSLQTCLVVPREDLSIAPASGYVPKLAEFTATSIAPGRTSEYERVQKELLPVFRKANVRGYLVSRVSRGGDTNQYNSLLLFDSFADQQDRLGPAFMKAVKEAQVTFPQPGIVMHQEQMTYRYLPELSLRASAQNAAK